MTADPEWQATKQADRHVGATVVAWAAMAAIP
jgi:hypothetical protein